MSHAALQRLTGRLPTRSAADAARAQTLANQAGPERALSALQAEGFAQRIQEVEQAARKVAGDGDTEALTIALDWLDAVAPSWLLDKDRGVLRASLLSRAVASGNPATVDLVLGKGVSANSADRGHTALREAVGLEEPDLLARLLALGVRESGVDANGLGLLHRVAQGRVPAMARMLVEAGWAIDQPDETLRGQTAMAHVIGTTQDPAMLTMFLSLGADARRADRKGNTPHAQLLSMRGTRYDAFARASLAEIGRYELERKTVAAQGGERRSERL